MPPTDPGMGNQSVSFELNDAVRRMENIRSLSGTLPSLKQVGDTKTPLGHRIPGIIQSLYVCRELLELTHPERTDITFDELKLIEPDRCHIFQQALIEVRRLEREINTQSALARRGELAE